MTKGECITMISACSAEDLGDDLLELAIAYKLEEGYSKEDIIDMVGIVLEDSGRTLDGD